MIKVIARVHPVHLINVDWATAGRQPSEQASRVWLWGSYHPHPPSPLLLFYSACKLILIFRPIKGGRLSRTRHYSKDAQPVPKAVYHSGCRDKHNRPRCDSNLGPLTPQSDALNTATETKWLVIIMHLVNSEIPFLSWNRRNYIGN